MTMSVTPIAQIDRPIKVGDILQVDGAHRHAKKLVVGPVDAPRHVDSHRAYDTTLDRTADENPWVILFGEMPIIVAIREVQVA